MEGSSEKDYGSTIANDKSNSNNYIYVGNSESGSGYSDGNSGYWQRGISGAGKAHEVMHLLDWRPHKNSDIGSHSSNAETNMGGAQVPVSGSEWNGIHNRQPISAKTVARKRNSYNLGLWRNGKVYNKKSPFYGQTPSSTPKGRH